MFPKPRADLKPNSAEFERFPLVKPTGFREYDARWLLGREPSPPGTTPEIQVQLPRGVPIYLTYTTAQVRDGKVAYFSDPYRLDPTGRTVRASGR